MLFQASKVKGSQNSTVAAAQAAAVAAVPPAETGQQPAKTDLPPVPKTPDAMDHMPEQMKTEYRRLKEQLALREKTRQPLSNVNQEKGGRMHTGSECTAVLCVHLPCATILMKSQVLYTFH